MKKYFKAIMLIFIVLLFSIFSAACNSNNKDETYYTVTFNSNGGSDVASVQVKKDELLTKPTDPTQEDFTFIGWYYEDEEWSFAENKVNQDLTLTAKWEHAFLLIDENNMLIGITDYGKTLEKVKIPNSVTSVKLGALSGCSSLESLSIPFVGNSENPYLVLVKASSTEITSCKIHVSTQIIMEYAFQDCNSLESVTFENPESWVVAETYILNSPITIPSSDLSNESSAAIYFTSTYKNYYWKRG